MRNNWFSLNYIEYADYKFNKGIFRLSLNSGFDDHTNLINPFVRISVDETIKHASMQMKYCEFAKFTHHLQNSFKNQTAYVYTHKSATFEISYLKDNPEFNGYAQIKINTDVVFSSVLIEVMDLFYAIKQMIHLRDNWISVVTDFAKPCYNHIAARTTNSLKEDIQMVQKSILAFMHRTESAIPLEAYPDVVIPKENENFENINNEFDDFIGGQDVSNIDFPYDISSNLPKVVDKQMKNNAFIDKILKGSLKTIESAVLCSVVSQDPVNCLLDSLIQNSDYLKDQFYLGCTSDAMKSLLYLQTYVYKSCMYNYIKNNDSSAIPDSIFPFYFEPVKRISKQHKEFLYCIFSIMIFYKLYKDRMSTKIADVKENKSLMYFTLRCLCDGIIFSNLKDDNFKTKKEELVLVVDSFVNSDIFNDYNQTLKNYGFEEITAPIIISTGMKVFDIVSTADCCVDVHKIMKDKNECKLQTNPDLELNEVIQYAMIESLIRNNERIISEEDFESRSIQATEKVKHLFINKTQVKKSKENSLFKYCSDRKNEIPSSIVQEFLEYTRNAIDSVDLNQLNESFTLSEFGTNILKALKLWDTNVEKDRYLDFVYLVEGSNLTKEDVLTNLFVNDSDNTQSVTPETSQDTDWDNISW